MEKVFGRFLLKGNVSKGRKVAGSNLRRSTEGTACYQDTQETVSQHRELRLHGVSANPRIAVLTIPR